MKLTGGVTVYSGGLVVKNPGGRWPPSGYLIIYTPWFLTFFTTHAQPTLYYWSTHKSSLPLGLYDNNAGIFNLHILYSPLTHLSLTHNTPTLLLIHPQTNHRYPLFTSLGLCENNAGIFTLPTLYLPLTHNSPPPFLIYHSFITYSTHPFFVSTRIIRE